MRLDLLKVAPDMVASLQEPLYLTAAGASDGPLREGAILHGESDYRRGKREWTTVYTFSEPGTERWLDCLYGDGGAVRLSIRLDDRISQCSITQRNDVKIRPRFVRVVCR